MSKSHLPVFSTLDVASFPSQLEQLLASNLQKMHTLLQQEVLSWDNLMHPLEEMQNEVEQLWSPFSHLHGVMNTPELRKSYEACLPQLTAYETAIGQNETLYQAIKQLEQTYLSSAQKKIIEDTLRNFQLSGVALGPEEKKRYQEIQEQLSTLTHQYENNVLDATQNFFLPITEEEKLKGLPAYIIDNAVSLAQERKVAGWVFNLEFPTYLAIISYAEDRALREAMYEAYVTRASDKGPLGGKYDNSNLMDQILALRHEEAKLLGFANYAELSLAPKMAQTPEEVLRFLEGLGEKSVGQAKQEFAALEKFGLETLGLKQIQPWDAAYLSEKKKQQQFTINEEELRPYFPLPKVMEGLFEIISRLYGMKVTQVKDVDIWHPEVTCYQIEDKEGRLRGHIYADLFARPNKRGGAWMDSIHSRFKMKDQSVQHPIATLTCNFAKPAGNKIPTLSHEEVQTLFHECGHCLHHVLTTVDYLSASGINGVEWDAVELPSQFFENWCWEKEGLDLLTAHEETGEGLPQPIITKLLAAKNFQSAMAMMRQLELSLFDFRMHKEYQDTPHYIARILEDVRSRTRLLPQAEYNRFQHSFTHIFSGGYSAGYYSYKWAELLSSDAFSRFEEEGIFNKKTGEDFLKEVLEVGSSRPANESFVAFRKRAPSIDPLLKHNGINAN